MCVWIGGEGRGWLSDCWVSRSGMTNDGEDHTENYRHNYQDDLPNRCFWMTEPWRPNAARIHTNANATCHTATLPFFLAASLCVQMCMWFKVIHKVCFLVSSGCALRMIVSSCSQVMAALAHFFRAMEASDAFTSAAHPISSQCSMGVFHSTCTRCPCAAKSGGSGLRKRQNSSLFQWSPQAWSIYIYIRLNKSFSKKQSEAVQWEASGSSCRGIPRGLKIGHNTPYITSGTSGLFTVFRSEKWTLYDPEWLTSLLIHTGSVQDTHFVLHLTH